MKDITLVHGKILRNARSQQDPPQGLRKLEIRISKSETNPKSEFPNYCGCLVLCTSLGFRAQDFGFILLAPLLVANSAATFRQETDSCGFNPGSFVLGEKEDAGIA
jgi:hypothetical protein